MAMASADPVKLEKQIRDYNRAYRRGEPLISDAEFDDLVELLHKVNPNAAWFKTGVNDEPESRKERLPIPMYSLEKVKSFDEIVRWIESCGLESTDKLVITPKYDGISLCVNEKTGDAWTRGDGEVGQACRDRFKKLNNSVFDLGNGEVTYTFGEAIFKNSEFLKIKEETQYKSARNAAAGLMNAQYISSFISAITYVRYGCDREDWDKQKQLDFLNQCGREQETFYTTVPVGSLIQSEDIFNDMMDRLFDMLTVNFKCDGLVIDVNSAEKRKELGRLPNNNPKYAIAYKNPDWSEREETKVEKVRWQISKDGRLSPVIDITPIDLCGATVSKCTAYNARYVNNNFIKEGSRVIICRSGDVIPKHLKTISYTFEKKFLPEVCPVCGKPLSWSENNVDLICTNSLCDGKRLAECVYFFTVMGFEEFGEPTIKKLFNAGYKSAREILNLTYEDLVKIEGIGNVGAKVLSKQFADLEKKGTNFAKLLTALNMFNGVIAEKTCQKILDGLKLYTYADVSSFAKECDESWATDIEKNVEGVGSITALAFINGVIDWWSNEEPGVSIPVTYYGLEEKSFEGQMTVVFTGFRSSEAENKLKEKGHKIGSSVSKKTTCLVVKEKGLGTTKEKKAEQYGIPIFTFEEFKEKFDI